MKIDHLPAVVAIPWLHFTEETNPRLKLWAACEVYEVLVRFGVMLQLAELRALPDADDRLAAAVARIRDHIGSPTLGKWLGMMSELAGQLRRTDPLVLPELPTLTNALAALAPKDAPREWDASLLALRNALAHGGGVTAPIAERLLADWEPLLRGAMESLACLAGTTVVWFEAGYARPITPDGGLAEALTISADLRTTLTAAGLDRRVLLLKGDRALNLWPLCDYAPATMSGWGGSHTTPGPVPQVYLRAETNRLLYAALGCDVPVHTSAAHVAFREFFGLNRKPEPHQPTAHDFAADLRAETAAVRGRKKELKKLKEMVKAATDRVLWVFGPGGIGKSYLVAKLAHDLSNGPQYATVFWRFRAGDADRCNKLAFFRHAILTLGNPVFGFVTTQAFPSLDPSQLLKQFLDLLNDAGTSTARRPLFVLDGMDEIARSDPDFVRAILEWRTGSAVWMCAGRFEGDLVPAVFAADRCQHVWAGGLPGLSEGEVRQMIDARIGSAHFARLLANDTDRDGGTYNQLTDAITRRAAGLPLYVHFVCEDILAGQLPLDGTLPTRLPESLAKYYDDLLRRRGIGDVDALKTPLVVLIAWTLAPLDTDTLRELLQRRRSLPKDRAKADDLLARGLEAVQSMLRPVAVDGGRVGYEPYHLTFRDHIQADGGVSGESETARDLYCECVSDWSRFVTNTPVRHYLLRHGSEHLLREKRWAELETLARDEAFLTAQRNELPTDPAAVIRTLQHALTGAGEQDSGIKMAEAVLRLADRYGQIRQASPLDLLRAGNLDGALTLADLQEPQRRVLWYLLLALELSHTGDVGSSVVVLRRLTQSTTPQVDGWMAGVAVNALAMLAPGTSLQSFTECLSILKEESKPQLVGMLISLDAHQPGCEQGAIRTLDLALRITASMRYGSASWELVDLVTLRARLGDLGGAIQAMKIIQLPYARCKAMAVIAVSQAKAGDAFGAAETFHRALQAAEHIEYTPTQCRALGMIAQAQAEAGDAGAATTFHRATQSSFLIEGDYDRRDVLPERVVWQAKSGDVGGALGDAHAISDAYFRSRAWLAVAEWRATAGDFAGADVYAHHALQAAELVEETYWRGYMYRLLAEFLARAGDATGSTEIFDRALRRAEALHDIPDRFERTHSKNGPHRGEELKAIAISQAKAGNTTAALRTTERLRDAYRNTALLEIVSAHLRAADVAGATRTVQLIEELPSRCEAMVRVAEWQATAGETSAAVQTLHHAVLYAARGIDDDTQRNQAFEAIAVARMSAGDTAGAVETGGWIGDESLRHDVWAAILASPANVADTAVLLTAAHRIKDVRLRAEGLVVIGVLRAKAGDTAGVAEAFHHAVVTAELLADASGRREALGLVEMARVMSYAELRDFVRATETAAAIEDGFARCEAFEVIAESQAMAGDVSGALHTAEGVEEQGVDWDAFEAIVRVQTQTGDTAGALRTAGRIGREYNRERALAGIAKSQAEAGDVAGALATAELIPCPHSQCDALAAAASALASAGNTAGAAELVHLALKTVGRIGDASRLGKALTTIAGAQAKAGDLSGAFQTADLIEAAGDRCLATAAIAVEEAEAGGIVRAAATFRRAVQTVRELHRQSDLEECYSKIAVSQARCKLGPEALETVERVLVGTFNHFPKIAEALVEQKALLAFKQYLLLAGRDIRTAIHACGQLARLYPADATAIAELLLARQRQHAG